MSKNPLHSCFHTGLHLRNQMRAFLRLLKINDKEIDRCITPCSIWHIEGSTPTDFLTKLTKL